MLRMQKRSKARKMMNPGPRGRTSGEHIWRVGECRRGAKFQGHKRVRKDRGRMNCTQRMVKNETWVATGEGRYFPPMGGSRAGRSPRRVKITEWVRPKSNAGLVG